MIGLRAFAGLGAVMLLAAGCAAPVVIQAASVAVDGATYLATGKGTGDHALSEVAGEDCRLSNLLKNRPICRPHRKPPAALIATLPQDSLAGVATFVSATDIGQAAAAAPAVGIAVKFTESPGMNMAEVIGAPVGAALLGRVGKDGALSVFMVGADGAAGERALFIVPGYSRNPGAFTGVVMGSRFYAPDVFVR